MTKTGGSVSDIELAFNEVCRLCAQLANNQKSIPTNSQYAILARRLLERFAAELRVSLGDLAWRDLEITVSRGQAVLPRILWVAITQRGKRVSESTSIAVCFGRRGEGAVAGLIDTSPAKNRAGFTPVKRTKIGNIQVDVDGNKQATSYNDKFANPREFVFGALVGEDLLAHIEESFRLMATLGVGLGSAGRN